MDLNFADDNKLNITLYHTTLEDLKIRISNHETHKLEFLHEL